MRQRVPVTPTTPPADLPAFLTVKQAAAYTQQCEWTIYQAIREGRIPAQRFGGKRILIPKEHFRAAARPEPVAEAVL